MTITLEQLKKRKEGIGGSDVAPILGVSKWKTPLDIYLDKVGEDIELQDLSPVQEWGNRLEPLIIQKFQEQTGLDCSLISNTVKHERHPFMLANVDAFIPSENAILECKTTSTFLKNEWGEQFTDQIPQEYLLQCAHYAEVLNVGRVYIAVLIGGNDFRVYVYDRLPRLGANLITKEKHFWYSHVQLKVAPQPLSDSDAVKLWLHSVKENVVTAPISTMEALERMKAIKNEIKKLEGSYETLEMEVFKFMQDNDQLMSPQGDILATWKAQTSNRFDSNTFKKDHPDLYNNYTKTTKTRILRVK